MTSKQRNKGFSCYFSYFHQYSISRPLFLITCQNQKRIDKNKQNRFWQGAETAHINNLRNKIMQWRLSLHSNRILLLTVRVQDTNFPFTKNPSFLFWKFHSPETPTTFCTQQTQHCFCYHNICFVVGSQQIRYTNSNSIPILKEEKKGKK